MIHRLFTAAVVGLCLGVGQAQDAAPSIRVETQPLMLPSACTGAFVAHDLDHIFRVPGGDTVRMFEANGGGVGLNDLDNDGDLDIVLANHAGMNTLLWNEGRLTFRTERLAQSDSRAVTLIDLDGDDWLDLVFSHNRQPPAYWRNTGTGRFTRDYLSGVSTPLYAINWGDVDHDGDLDLAGATYDASLLTDFGQDFLREGKGGVYVYEQRGTARFTPQVLASSAQGLALALVDLNADGHLDIWVGNDFAVPDQRWLWSAAGWQALPPLTVMSYSTMSLDVGDVNNDGQDEMFSTDMKSQGGDSAGERALQAVTNDIDAGRDLAADPQITANVLQTLNDTSDDAAATGLDATGWSWSGKFGDLDQDGWLDVYVVNGFMEATTFRDLPNHELVQPNQVFRNHGDGTFAPMPAWGLGSLRSGRGMSMADLDGDGDLDIVVNNLNSAAQLFENQLCTGRALLIDLRWPHSGNTRAIGARLTLTTDAGVLTREVKAASGYLSGDAAQVHFGFPQTAHIQRLDIVWPDGVRSTLESLTAHTRLTITREG